MMVVLPFSTTVPTPVAVSTPPSPKPPARIRSMSVPCGTSSTSVLPAIICCCVSGLRPMWLTIARRTSPARMSLPMPTPGMAVSFAITVRFPVPRRTSSSMTRSGVPTPMKPPIITLARSGISDAASPSPMVFTVCEPPDAPSLREPRAVDRKRRAANLRRRLRAQEGDRRADLLRRRELAGRLLPREQRMPRLIDGQTLTRGEVRHLLLHERSEHPARTDRVARHARRGRLERDHLREAEHSVLGRDVSGLVHRADQAVRRRDVDDPSPVAAAHPGERGANPVKHRREVDRENRVPALGGKILHGRRELDARVVDQDIHGPEVPLGLGHHLRDLDGRGHVGRAVRDGHAMLARQVRDHAGDRARRPEPVEHHGGAVPGERLRDTEADAARRSRDHRYAPLERQRTRLMPLLQLGADTRRHVSRTGSPSMSMKTRCGRASLLTHTADATAPLDRFSPCQTPPRACDCGWRVSVYRHSSKPSRATALTTSSASAIQPWATPIHRIRPLASSWLTYSGLCRGAP